MDLSQATLDAFDSEFKRDAAHRVVQGVLSAVSISDVVSDQNVLRTLPLEFNVQLQEQVNVTNQYHSGRCWAFAGLNVLRHKLIAAYKLPPDFELSQTHTYRHDKLERCNTAMETIFRFKQRGVQQDSLEYATIIPDILDDGGTWQFFVNIVAKYGVVPRVSQPDNFQAKNTDGMNQLILTAVMQSASSISPSTTRSQFMAVKASVLRTCHRIVTLCLGNDVGSFEWAAPPLRCRGRKIACDKKKLPRSFTAKTFYEKIVAPLIDISKFVCLTNDPRHPADHMLGVENVHNVLGRNDDVDKTLTNTFLNLDPSIVKAAVLKTLQRGTGVYFGCDYTRFVVRNSVMDQDASNVEDMFDARFTTDRRTSLINRTIVPNHAMLFVGCNLRRSDGAVDRYKVENSHGTDPPPGQNTSILVMSDRWFDAFVTCVVAPASVLSAKTRRLHATIIREGTHGPRMIKLKAWDTLGTKFS